MVNVSNELKKLGIEVSDEQKESLKKSMGEELYSKRLIRLHQNLNSGKPVQNQQRKCLKGWMEKARKTF